MGICSSYWNKQIASATSNEFSDDHEMALASIVLPKATDWDARPTTISHMALVCRC